MTVGQLLRASAQMMPPHERPVMPTTRISRLGWPKNCAASSASARRASLTTTHGTAAAAAGGCSATTAAAPAPIACAANAAPSLCCPFSATNTTPGVTCRESCVTPPHVRSSNPASPLIAGRSFAGIACATVRSSSPTVIAGRSTAA